MPEILELQKQRPVACSELETSLVYINKFKTSMATCTVTLCLNLVLPWERLQLRGEASEGLAGRAQDCGRGTEGHKGTAEGRFHTRGLFL